ncbi:hypothetical protein K1719_027374 [Acacia pycnantha]|nr:hypothetical protein K1719_027374 [Acacia pycnantha]
MRTRRDIKPDNFLMGLGRKANQPSPRDPVLADRPSPSRDFNVPVHCVGDLLMVWDFCTSFALLRVLMKENVELQESKLIVQKWRFGNWPDGIHSTDHPRKDTQALVVVRLWKGYRDPSCLFMEMLVNKDFASSSSAHHEPTKSVDDFAQKFKACEGN